MANKSIIGGFLRAIGIAIVVFFLLFFFAPETSSKYLGTSFRDVRQKAAGKADDAIKAATDYVMDKISDPAFLADLQKKAASEGSEFADALKVTLSASLEKAGDFTASEKAKLESKLSNPATISSLKKAAAKGEDSLEKALDKIVEAVR